MAEKGAHEAEKLLEARLLQIDPWGAHLGLFPLCSLDSFSLDSVSFCLELGSFPGGLLGPDLGEVLFIQDRPANLRTQGKAFRILTNAQEATDKLHVELLLVVFPQKWGPSWQLGEPIQPWPMAQGRRLV